MSVPKMPLMIIIGKPRFYLNSLEAATAGVGASLTRGRGLEAVDGVEHTVGVPDGKVEEVVDAGV